MNIRHASLTDVGVKRSHNQDACASQPAADDPRWRSHGHVFIVADGMGGHAVGEKASAKAVSDIPLTYLKHVGTEGVPAAMRRAFHEANEAIFQIGVNNPEFEGLGTTGTAIVVRPEGVWVGHVGDSRAYRVRGDRIQQLTFDHSWVWEYARRQGIDPDELGNFKRNVIIRSLGPALALEVDIEGPHPIEPGDSFVLCSDGLTNEVAAEEIGAVVRMFPPDEASRYLVELANIRGGRDNVTCLIAQIPDDAAGIERARPRRVARGLARAARGVRRRVPWPFLVLALGALLAGASVFLQVEGIRALAVAAFLLAVGQLLAGLVGLYSYLRNRPDPAATPPAEGPAELHLYRDYAFEIGPALVERFTQMEAGLAEVCQGRDGLTLDWDARAALDKEVAERTQKHDWRGAFAARFRAVQLLAAAYNRTRQKDEAFQPNWTRAAGSLLPPGC